MRPDPTASRHGRSRRFIRRFASFGSVVLLALTGCASGPPTAVPPGPGQTLAKDEGFVVVHVDTELKLERLEANGRPIALDLHPGRHLWLVRMKAGRQRWTAVKFEVQPENDSPIRPRSKGVLNEQEFEFDVEAGAVNYPGEIIVRMRIPEWGANMGVSVRNRNHSAIAIRELMKSHPALLADHPLRYAGKSGDEFLQFYTKERERLRTDGASERASAEHSR